MLNFTSIMASPLVGKSEEIWGIGHGLLHFLFMVIQYGLEIHVQFLCSVQMIYVAKLPVAIEWRVHDISLIFAMHNMADPVFICIQDGWPVLAAKIGPARPILAADSFFVTGQSTH